MKILRDILYKVAIKSVVGSTDSPIDFVAFDSRKVSKNTLFIAISGNVVDGHAFITSAIESGAIAIICEHLPSEIISGITYICVEDANLALAIIANNFYDSPSSKLRLVGVTGTNGKTTVATLLYRLFTNLGYKVGLLSTVKILVADEKFETSHTTPDSLTINYYLNEMVVYGK